MSATLIKMDTKSLEIKNKTNYNWDDIIYINDFDVNSLEIIKRESRIGANIYYTGMFLTQIMIMLLQTLYILLLIV